jgi:hypothetical protein
MGDCGTAKKRYSLKNFAKCVQVGANYALIELN